MADKGGPAAQKAFHRSYAFGPLNAWTLMHSAICLLAGAILWFQASYRQEAAWETFVVILSAYGPLAFFTLFALQGKGTVSIPNAVSLIRLIGGEIALVISLFSSPWNGSGELSVFILLVLSGLSDAADGIAARKTGTTLFGAKLDMELDAYFIFLLSALALWKADIGSWVILAGLMRYAYVFVLLLIPQWIELPGWIRLTEKSICALTSAALILQAAPLAQAEFKTTGALVALVLLGISFLLDLAARIAGRFTSHVQREPSKRGAAF